MKIWWTNLSLRERILIYIAGGLIILFVGIQIVLVPALENNQAGRMGVDRSARILDTITMARPHSDVSSPTSTRTQLDPDTFRRLILESANQKGLKISRVQMSDDNNVVVQLDDASEQLIFLWLLDLKRTTGAETSRATITQASEGKIRSSFEFSVEN